jgi:threonine dehydrogenase-like Zn-dependent dehydrogenase
VLRAAAVDPAAIDELVAFIDGAGSPALVVGAGVDDPASWAALVDLAERLAAPVFQESFGARAGFPQDHGLFGGFLPADRPRLRERLAPHDVILVVGAPVFRQSPYAPGRFVEPGTRVEIDSAGGPGFGKLIDVAAPGGRIAFFGATRGDPPVLPMRKVFWRHLSLLGSTMGSPADWSALMDFVQRHKIKPVVSEVFPMERAGDAFALMEKSAQFGKIVVKIAE